MAKATKFTATFKGGVVVTRSSKTKDYTHAWRWTGIDGDDRPVGGSGFSTSRLFASHAVQRDSGWVGRRGGTVTSSEVVQVTRGKR